MRNGIISLIAVLLWAGLAQARTITVGKTGPYDFNNIRAAMNDANEGDTVLVYPGFYDEYISFMGKNIIVKSTNPVDPNVVASTVIDGSVSFRGSEDANCTLSGFKINFSIWGTSDDYDPTFKKHTHATISYCILSNIPIGIAIWACDGLISNCLISDNAWDPVMPTVWECHGLFRNCTVAGNSGWIGIYVGQGGTTTIENCIIYYNAGGTDYKQIAVEEGTVNISYSDIQNGINGVILWGEPEGVVNWGLGNIDNDPCFVLVGHFYRNISGDYHLKSEGWRWDVTRKVWTWDDVTSRCIDAGNPGSSLGEELLTIPVDPENLWGINKRIDMGAYGGTIEASMPPYNWALLADLNNDGIVDFIDFAYFSNYWLTDGEELPSDLDRNRTTNCGDLQLFIEDWLQATSWN